MADRTAVAMDSGGRAVVVKRGDPDRLRHEAAMLGLAAHPGVVALTAAPEGEDALGQGMVCTSFVGGGTIADRSGRPLDTRLATEVAISVAATMADLHDRRIAHRRLSGDHVLVADGKAVVCGLAEAALVAESAGSGLDDDVAAVARLVDDLSAACTGPGADELRQVARRVLDCSPEGRPSMRGLAGVLAGLAPGPRRAQPSSGAGPRRLTPRTDPGPRRRWGPPAPGVPVVLAVLALAAGAGLLLSLLPGGGTGGDALSAAPDATTARPTATSSPPPSTTPPSPPTPRRLWPAPTCPAVGGAVTADVDGDGCDEEVGLEAGVASSAAGRWQVGRPDDDVTLGDWDCDGRSTPAVLRPGSGQLWVFAGWAGAGEEIAATLAGVVPGAVSARTLERSDEARGACDRIEVRHPDATTTIVTPP